MNTTTNEVTEKPVVMDVSRRCSLVPDTKGTFDTLLAGLLKMKSSPPSEGGYKLAECFIGLLKCPIWIVGFQVGMVFNQHGREYIFINHQKLSKEIQVDKDLFLPLDDRNTRFSRVVDFVVRTFHQENGVSPCIASIQSEYK